MLGGDSTMRTMVCGTGGITGSTADGTLRMATQ